MLPKHRRYSTSGQFWFPTHHYIWDPPSAAIGFGIGVLFTMGICIIVLVRVGLRPW